MTCTFTMFIINNELSLGYEGLWGGGLVERDRQNPKLIVLGFSGNSERGTRPGFHKSFCSWTSENSERGTRS